MRTVHFYGWLADEYGERLSLNVDSVGGMVRLMEANYPQKFIKSLRNKKFHIVLGSDLDKGNGMTEAMLPMMLGKNDIHVLPVVEGHGGGGKSKGLFAVILGVALIATAFVAAPAIAAGGLSASMGATAFGSISYGQIAMFGASLVLQGISGMLTPTPAVNDYSQREAPDQRPSFIFNGAVNMVSEGEPVPILYGRFMCGSVVVSGGIEVEQIPVGGSSFSGRTPVTQKTTYGAVLNNAD